MTLSHLAKAKSKTIKLSNYSFDNYQDVKAFIANIEMEYSALGISEHDAWYLVTTYGKPSLIILERMQQNEGMELVEAELWYTMEYEAVATPVDFFARRTGRIYFDIESVKENKDKVATAIQNAFHWNSETRADIREEVEDMLEDASIFYETETVD